MSNEGTFEPLLENASESSEEIPEPTRSESNPTTQPLSQHMASNEIEDNLPHGSSSQSADVDIRERRLIEKLHASPPSADRSPPFGDYDIIDGVPVRILETEYACEVHALSEDGELFAAKGSEKDIRVWRRSDYILVGKKRSTDVHAMSFLDGKSDVLRVVERIPDEDFKIVDLRIKRSDKESHPTSKCLDDNLEVISRRQISFGETSSYAKFSDDGRILFLACADQMIKVYKFQNAELLQDVVEFKELGLTLPDEDCTYYWGDMSPNGQTVWVSFRRKEDETSEEERKLAVWPKVQFDRDAAPDPVILPGERGVWSASGAYLVVWDKGKPRLNVYKIEHLADNILEPIATKMLLPGIHAWQAIGLKRSECSLLLREICTSKKERYSEWDFTKDVVSNEIFVDRKTVNTINTFYTNLYKKSDVYPSFAEDGMDWIGSVALDGSFAIVSRSSGAIVFKPNLSEDIAISWYQTRVRFDPSGQHVLVIGAKCILAFAPASFQDQGSWQRSALQISKEDLWNDDDTSRQLHQLGNCAFGALRGDTYQRAKFHFFTDLVDEQIAVSSNGRWCACFRETDYSILEDDDGRYRLGPKKYVASIIHLKNSCDDESCWDKDADIIHTCDDRQSVFVSPNDDGSDRVTFLDMHDSPKLLVFDVDSEGKRGDKMDVFLDCEECLHVCQTRDLKSLVILERRAVCLFDLKTLSVQERIAYETDFMEVTKDLKKDDDSPSWWLRRMTRRSVSNDGRIVLLGWDTKARRSILATPETEQQECEAAISEAGEVLSPFCELTEDGDCTLFADVEEFSNSRIVVGICPNNGESEVRRSLRSSVLDLKVHKRVCYAKDIFKNRLFSDFSLPFDRMSKNIDFFDHVPLFFGMSTDGSELLVLVIRESFLAPCIGPSFERGLKKYTVYGTEECIPNHNSLIFSFNGTMTQTAQRLVDTFGPGHVFNHPVSKGLSIFQEAFLKGDRAMVKDIVDFAKHKGLELAGRSVDKDLLTESINRGIVQNVEEAFSLKMSDQCPAKERLAMTSRDISDAMRLASHRVTKALKEDEFVVELCHIEVHTDFLNPVIRRDKGVHIDTADEVLNWKLDDSEEVLSQKWRDDHLDIVDEMEKDGNQSKSTASVKVLCVDGAARPGPLGLVRHLLLHRVPEDVFKSRAVKWIVSWKWFKIWKPKFIRQFLWHVAFLACLTAYIIVLGKSSDLVDAEPWIKISTSVLVFVLVAYGVLMAMDEKRELMSLVNEGRDGNRSKWKGVRYYFSSKWNWVDTALCMLLLVMMPLFHVLSLFLNQCNPVLSAVMAVVVLLSYIKVWYYAQPFRITGAVVLMIENIIKDCLPFLGLVSIMLIGFVLAILVMFRSVIHKPDGGDVDETVADAFGTFPKGVLTLFYALLGDFDSEVYAVKHELRVLVIITFGIYMIVQVVVLLNLLISIMGDTFDRVKSNEEGQMLMARAMIIDSCEASATKAEMEEIEKMTRRYIYAVEGTDDGAEDTAPGWWTGKFNMMIEKLRTIIMKDKDRTESIVKEEIKMLEKIASLGDEMKEKAASFGDEMQEATRQQEQRIAGIELQLQQLSTKLERAISLLEAQSGT